MTSSPEGRRSGGPHTRSVDRRKEANSVPFFAKGPHRADTAQGAALAGASQGSGFREPKK